MKIIYFALTLLLALSGCASVPSATPPQVTCPAPPPVAAWILAPQPDLLPTLNKIISPFAVE